MFGEPNWGVLVSVCLNVFLAVLPEKWRPPIVVFGAAFLLVFSIIGASFAKIPFLRKLRDGPKGKHPMTLLAVGLFGFVVAVGLWLAIVGKTASTAEQHQPTRGGFPGFSLGGHSEVTFEHNIFPDTTHIEATDNAKGSVSGNLFYQTQPAPANPQTPYFVAKIWMMEMSYAETEEKPLVIFALLEIKNRGSPSVVDKFHGTLEVDDKTWEIQRSQRLPRDFTILRDDNSEIKMDEADMLYSRLSGGNPIVQGGRLAGWLMFVVKGGPIDPKKFKFTIYFSDVTGKEYPITTSNDELSTSSVPFVPGVNNPFLPKQPSPNPGKEEPPH